MRKLTRQELQNDPTTDIADGLYELDMYWHWGLFLGRWLDRSDDWPDDWYDPEWCSCSHACRCPPDGWKQWAECG